MESEKLADIADENVAKQLDRLARYRGQHERAFYRALRELKDLQTSREILERMADPARTDVAPLADFIRLRKVGFVLSNRTHQVCNALEAYLFAPPPDQSEEAANEGERVPEAA